MIDEVIPLLKVHEYFRSLPDEVLSEVARSARVAHHAAGTVVHETNAPVSAVGFVLRGRLKAVRVDARGAESLFRMIERGEQFGMMIGALTEPVPIRVIALEPTTVLELDYEQAMDLTARFPDLRRMWLSTFAGSLRQHFFGAARKRAPMVLALVHESAATRRTGRRLVERLRDLGEDIAVLGDTDELRAVPGVRFRSLTADGRELEDEEIRQQAAEWHGAGRIVFDLHADMPADRAAKLLAIADRVLFFVTAAGGEAAARRLQSLDVPGRGWRDKLGIVWVLNGSNIAPDVPALQNLTARDFKIIDPLPGPPFGPMLGGGLERLVHDLRGLRIGVALGGGAARGMSHLGVLKALERNGIVVDTIAGTSAGAMSGVVYASGLDADYSASQFAADLRPSWLFRRMPRGDHWYLLYKYRRGQFDPMLRKYLSDWRLQQLAVSCLTVTADLVSGGPIVRDRGDAIHAVLESINLPVLSVPIIREGKALIDGGLVNNIPADTLVARGCNFVIAVSVTAKMEHEFCEIAPHRPEPPRRKPSIVQTLLRSLLVQNHNLNAIGVGPADVVIEPDVTAFELTDFKRSKELAVVGEAAALEQIPRIRQLLTRLDPQLYPATTVNRSS